MEETPTTTEAVNETVAPEQEQPEATQAEDTSIEEPASGATPVLDEYDKRIESLLEAHEKRQNNADDAEEAKQEETLREGESWQSVLEGAPEDVQRAMASLRADYTRKTQELASQRKELARQQKALTDSDAYKAIAELAHGDDVQFDPFDPQSFNAYVNKVVAERLNSILEPMRQEQLQFQAQNKLEAFMVQHPELKTDQQFRKEVHQTLTDNEHLDLEAAYWIVQGRRAKAQEQNQNQKIARTKKAARAAGLAVGSGRKSGVTVPKDEKLNAWDIYNHILQQK
tara:strand:+ start:1264 stop:2115 length:852 start_codon:yes stop_codon:yes gene_type:complete